MVVELVKPVDRPVVVELFLFQPLSKRSVGWKMSAHATQTRTRTTAARGEEIVRKERSAAATFREQEEPTTPVKKKTQRNKKAGRRKPKGGRRLRVTRRQKENKSGPAHREVRRGARATGDCNDTAYHLQ